MSGGVKFSLRPAAEILGARGMEPGGKVQKFIDSEVLRQSEPYTPHLSGMLSRSGTAMTKIGTGEVRWKTPYARYQYYGKVMVGAAPKIVTNIDLKYYGGGLRGAKWFERMKTDHRDSILKGAAAAAGVRSK